MFKWIPDFKVTVSKGHIILYVVVTIGLLWLTSQVYNLGYEEGWQDAYNYYAPYINW